MRIPVRMAATVSVAMLALVPSGPRPQASTLGNLQGARAIAARHREGYWPPSRRNRS